MFGVGMQIEEMRRLEGGRSLRGGAPAFWCVRIRAKKPVMPVGKDELERYEGRGGGGGGWWGMVGGGVVGGGGGGLVPD